MNTNLSVEQNESSVILITTVATVRKLHTIVRHQCIMGSSYTSGRRGCDCVCVSVCFFMEKKRKHPSFGIQICPSFPQGAMEIPYMQTAGQQVQLSFY